MHTAWITTWIRKRRNRDQNNFPWWSLWGQQMEEEEEEVEIGGRRWESWRGGHHKLLLMCCAVSHLLLWPGLTGMSCLCASATVGEYECSSSGNLPSQPIFLSFVTYFAPRLCEGQYIAQWSEVSGIKAGRLWFHWWMSNTLYSQQLPLKWPNVCHKSVTPSALCITPRYFQ